MAEQAAQAGRTPAPKRPMTLAEVLLWNELRGRGKPVFRRQRTLGPYVLDFFCAKARLCVLVHGEAHWAGGRQARDRRRDAYLVEQGVFTVRVSAAAALADPRAVGRYLIELAQSRCPKALSG